MADNCSCWNYRSFLSNFPPNIDQNANQIDLFAYWEYDNRNISENIEAHNLISFVITICKKETKNRRSFDENLEFFELKRVQTSTILSNIFHANQRQLCSINFPINHIVKRLSKRCKITFGSFPSIAISILQFPISNSKFHHSIVSTHAGKSAIVEGQGLISLSWFEQGPRIIVITGQESGRTIRRTVCRTVVSN